ncbi:hypothetical protein [Paenisporosarcina sp. NPDC076898]|uniref:hypothetical protein n=1 Tax=unclassified Paenisporosarcina TaxID=2642018 RepID=UPI003D067B21
MFDCCEGILTIQESEILIDKYKKKFIDRTKYNYIWEGVGISRVEQFKISYVELMKFAEGIKKSYVFTHFLKDYPNFQDHNRIRCSNSIAKILEINDRNPQDLYFFDNTFNWTIISSHEFLDLEEKFHYMLIRN